MELRKLFTTQAHRMEGYAVIGLVFMFFGFSHLVWGWPGSPDKPAPAHPATTGTLGWTMNLLTADNIWRFLFMASFLSVGLLFFFSYKRARNGASSTSRQSDVSPSEREELSRLRIYERNAQTKEEYDQCRMQLTREAPRLSIKHSIGDDGYEHLLFRNIMPKEARALSVKWVRCEKNYMCDSIPERVDFVDRNSREEIKLKPIVKPLREILDIPGDHSLMVYFEDSTNHCYGQKFDLRVHDDGSIEFNSEPGSVTLLD